MIAVWMPSRMICPLSARCKMPSISRIHARAFGSSFSRVISSMSSYSGLVHVIDGFCLRQIDPAAGECPLGEFTGPCEPGTLCEHELQDLPGDETTAMTADLYDVLSCVGTRCTKQ